MHLTVYDKVRQLIGRSVEADYIQALIERRWGNEEPRKATRVEFQCSRRWLLNNGVSSPMEFFGLQGALVEKLTGEWFWITTTPVDRKNKNQSRAETHPLWLSIQKAFRAIYGEPVGELKRIERDKILPIQLIKQGRGCLRSALLQMKRPCRNYAGFVAECGRAMERLGLAERDSVAFMDEYERRQMEYLG